MNYTGVATEGYGRAQVIISKINFKYLVLSLINRIVTGITNHVL